jgi:hypothetical protein
MLSHATYHKKHCEKAVEPLLGVERPVGGDRGTRRRHAVRNTPGDHRVRVLTTHSPWGTGAGGREAHAQQQHPPGLQRVHVAAPVVALRDPSGHTEQLPTGSGLNWPMGPAGMRRRSNDSAIHHKTTACV